MLCVAWCVVVFLFVLYVSVCMCVCMYGLHMQAKGDRHVLHCLSFVSCGRRGRALCNIGWPGIHSVDQVVPEHREIHRLLCPLSARIKGIHQLAWFSTFLFETGSLTESGDY